MTIFLVNKDEILWTPELIGSVTPGTQTYGTQYGFFQQFTEELAFLHFRIVLTAFDPATAGQIRIIGLPRPIFAAVGGSFGLALGDITNVTFDPGYTAIGAFVQQGQSFAAFSQFGSGLPPLAVGAINMANNSAFGAAGVVRIA